MGEPGNITNPQIVNVLGIIGGVFLTIFIPIAIGIFKNEEDYKILDKNVILDQVVKAHFFLYYLVAIFFPLLLWEASPLWLRVVWLIIWTAGIICVSISLINSYGWLKEKKFSLRFAYLKNPRDIQDMGESWFSVWQTKNINPENETKFFKIFSDTIDKLLESPKDKDTETAAELLNDFRHSFSNRSIVFIFYSQDVFTKILEWHFRTWRKNKAASGFLSLNNIIKKIEERAFKEENSFCFFEEFNTHIKNNKDKGGYIKWLINIFYRVFFENINSLRERREFLAEYFPEEWKITTDNLINENCFIARTSWNNFRSWAGPRILQRDTQDIDHDLDVVAKDLFSAADPVLWAGILTFLMRPYRENKRVKSFIDGGMNFGFMGRVIFSMDDDSARFEAEEKETIKLAMLLFKDQFTKVRLKIYIDELEELKGKYKVGTSQEELHTRFTYIFKKMRDEYNN